MSESHDAPKPTGPRMEHPPIPEAAPLTPPAPPPASEEPPKGWGQLCYWIRHRPWPVMLFIGLFILAFAAWSLDSCAPECSARPFWSTTALPLLTLVWVAVLFAWFIDCFTGDPFERRTKGIEFAYFFMVLSFCLVAIMIADIGKARKFGVVEGCVENLTPSVFPIQCDLPKRLPPVAQGGVSDTKKEGGTSDRSQQGAGAGGTPPPLPDPATKPRAPDALSFTVRQANYIDNRNYHYLLNIGGHLDRLEPPTIDCKDCKTPMFAVRGGLPVPVYFIVLALIGGAISLAKNVPGIQKRSDVGWQGTPIEPRLTPGEVRELLLFQVLQFVSAPLLAVAAYHTIRPDSMGSTVALGFLVGFGSDQILASIRGMVKGSQGAVATPIGTSIQGTVTRAGDPVANATVALDGTTLTTRTDAKGEFILLAVPIRTEPYLLKVTAAEKKKQLDVKAVDPAPVKLGTIDLA